MASASESFDTTWPAKAHTLAKHAVLSGYLKAWFPILSRGNQHNTSEILYIDGFAGPGEYSGGEVGSPVIALRTAAAHQQNFPKPIHFLFVEKDGDRIEHLTALLEKMKAECINRNIGKIDVKKGECEAEINSLLDGLKKSGKSFGPALAFLDQFGFTGVSMELIKRILSHDKCEAIIYLDYDGINRFGLIEDRAPGLNRVFGNDKWRDVIGNGERACRFYLQSLKDHAKVKYTFSFSMFDKHGVLLYWLIFCTNSIRGLEEMKKAMWKVDDTGNFRFSDKECPGQMQLLEDAFDQDWLAEKLSTTLVGKELSVQEIKEFVLTETPCFLFKDALGNLERRDALTPVAAPSSRKKCSFADDNLKLRFGILKPLVKKAEPSSLFEM